jgi:hypothetical protein
VRRMCANNCGRAAVYVRRGRRKARNDHDLCTQCWRAVLDKARADKEAREWQMATDNLTQKVIGGQAT